MGFMAFGALVQPLLGNCHSPLSDTFPALGYRGGKSHETHSFGLGHEAPECISARVSSANNAQAAADFPVHFCQPPSKSLGADETSPRSLLSDREQGISQLLNEVRSFDDLLHLKLGPNAESVAPSDDHCGVCLT